MKHPVSRDLHRYWDALRAGRTAPERSEIDPAAIRHILAYTFILDLSGGGLTRDSRSICFRLSGTRLNALFQRDLKGVEFRSIWSPDHSGIVESMLEATVDDRSAVVGSVRGAPCNHDAIDLELLMLPLRHHGKTHARLLGSLATAERPGWMGLRTIQPLDLLSFRSMIGHPRWPRPLDVPHQPPRIVGTRTGPFRVYEGGRHGDVGSELGF